MKELMLPKVGSLERFFFFKYKSLDQEKKRRYKLTKSGIKKEDYRHYRT